MSYSYKALYIQKDSWKTPFYLSLLFHAGIAVSVVLGPQIFKSEPPYQEIYTVDLSNFVEDVPPAPPPPAPVIEKKVPENARKIAPIAEAAPPPPKPTKAISLKPLKKKVKKKIVQKPDTQSRQLERRKQLAEAIRAEQAAAEAARIAQQEAALQRELLRENLADARRVASENNARSAQKSSSTGRKSSADLTGVEKQFFNAITIHITPYWQLPQYKAWENSLETIVAVTLAGSGKIKNMYIERSSGDKMFDQFVLKSLRAADPLPAIPPAMKKNYFDVGLRFRPGGIR